MFARSFSFWARVNHNFLLPPHSMFELQKIEKFWKFSKISETNLEVFRISFERSGSIFWIFFCVPAPCLNFKNWNFLNLFENFWSFQKLILKCFWYLQKVKKAFSEYIFAIIYNVFGNIIHVEYYKNETLIYLRALL